MSESDRWLLPEGIEEVLPGQAERLEQLRRRLLDLFQRWGYDLVFPPLIEYLESLLTGSAYAADPATARARAPVTNLFMSPCTPEVCESVFPRDGDPGLGGEHSDALPPGKE